MPKSSSKRSKSNSNSKDKKKKEKKEKAETVKEEVLVEEPVAPVAPVAPVVQKETKKTRKTETVKKVTPVVVETTPTTEAAETTEQVEVGKRQRRTVTKESILDDFDKLLEELDQEVEALRTADTKDAKARKTKGVKFMRSVAKRVKSLRNDSSRVMRTRKQSTRPKNTSSGFMKPVQISEEMATFTGWEPDVPRSRVDVTKYLCQYIRENNLQNPEDRRIIRPDNQLKTLLKLQNSDSEKNPLTYYSLQKSIQHHFTNDAKKESV